MAIAKYKGRQVVRCGGKKVTPYLKKQFNYFKGCKKVLDLGCGEGRNSRFLQEQGILTHPFDMCPDYGQEWSALEWIPVPDKSMDGVLLNYILMFLNDAELENVAREVCRVTKPGSVIMVELDLVKSSRVKTAEHAAKLKRKFLKLMGTHTSEPWDVQHDTKLRFILKKRDMLARYTA